MRRLRREKMYGRRKGIGKTTTTTGNRYIDNKTGIRKKIKGGK